MTEPCFECCGRQWVGPPRPDVDTGLTYADRCPRCIGTGYEPETHPEKAWVTR